MIILSTIGRPRLRARHQQRIYKKFTETGIRRRGWGGDLLDSNAQIRQQMESASGGKGGT